MIIVLSSLGNLNEATIHMLGWLSKLPRQIERSLGKLRNDGLLSTEEQAMLAHASLQREDYHRQLVHNWIADTQTSDPVDSQS